MSHIVMGHCNGPGAKKVSDMISDDQIMKTQTCFLQEMVQKERIQPRTFDLVHLVPFCLSLLSSSGPWSPPIRSINHA